MSNFHLCYVISRLYQTAMLNEFFCATPSPPPTKKLRYFQTPYDHRNEIQKILHDYRTLYGTPPKKVIPIEKDDSIFEYRVLAFNPKTKCIGFMNITRKTVGKRNKYFYLLYLLIYYTLLFLLIK